MRGFAQCPKGTLRERALRGSVWEHRRIPYGTLCAQAGLSPEDTHSRSPIASGGVFFTRQEEPEEMSSPFARTLTTH
jgi:hypothetical protein